MDEKQELVNSAISAFKKEKGIANDDNIDDALLDANQTDAFINWLNE